MSAQNRGWFVARAVPGRQKYGLPIDRREAAVLAGARRMPGGHHDAPGVSRQRAQRGVATGFQRAVRPSPGRVARGETLSRLVGARYRDVV